MIKKTNRKLHFILLTMLMIWSCSSKNKPVDNSMPTGVDMNNNMMANAVQEDVKKTLKTYCSLQETHYSEEHTYANSMYLLGYAKTIVVAGDLMDFTIEIISGDRENFKIRATASSDVDNDGLQDVWEVDKKCEPLKVLANLK